MTQLDNRLNGFYRGIVIQHLSHGYCKIFIFGVYPIEWKDSPDLLPKAEQASAIFGGCNNGNGMFTYPNIGSTVWCFFANGDQNYPVYFASTLGGENAFGQHETVKQQQEEISEKHLITSGKSHLEFQENGKISAVVYDPIRTDATVDFEKDHTTSRPIVEDVDNSEISNVNCQIVLDNKSFNGEISSQNHYYCPINELSTIILSAEQTTIISSLNGEKQYDHFLVRNNCGNYDSTQISSSEISFKNNVTTIPTKETEITLADNETNVAILEKSDINGKQSFNLISSYYDSNNYSYVNGNKNSIITELNKKESSENNIFRIDVQDQIEASTTSTSDSLYTYVNTETQDAKLKKEKRDFQNKLLFDQDGKFSLESSTKSKLNETDQKISKNHQNKHDVYSKIDADSENHIKLDTKYYDNDVLELNGSTVQKIYKNQSTANLGTFSKAEIQISTKEDSKLIINGIEKKYNTECSTNLLASEGKIQIVIKNNLDGNACTITMTNAGVINVDATSTINVNAPNMNFVGESFSANFQSMLLKSGTMNILGSSGDCKIANVSLLQHKHMETQSGDVVSPQNSQTAKASN